MNLESTKSIQNYRTPGWFFQGFNKALHFTLDAAADENNTLVPDNYLTMEQNALKRDWKGNVWCNPPYRYAGKFVSHGRDQVRLHGSTVCFLLRVPSMGTKWFLAAAPDAVTLIVTPRLDFLDPVTGEVDKSQGIPWSSIVMIFSPDYLRENSNTQGLRVHTLKAINTRHIMGFFGLKGGYNAPVTGD